MKALKGLKFADGVIVTWMDAGGSGGWSSLHEMPADPITVKQLGYYLRHDSKGLHLAQGIPQGEDCVVLGPSVIPIGCITDVKKVKV